MTYEALPQVPEVALGEIEAREAGRRDRRRGGRRGAGRTSPPRPRTSRTARRAPRPRTATRSSIDFKGSVDGEPFEGGAAEDFPLVLGSNSFIPGFEEQLVGVKAGDELEVKVTFPESLRRQAPRRQGGGLRRDGQGGEGAEAGRDRRRAGQALRRRDPRRAEGADPRPARRRIRQAQPGDPEAPADGRARRAGRASSCRRRWSTSRRSRSPTSSGTRSTPTTTATTTTTIEPTDEHRKLAERRVRLGLLLAEIGTKHEITVSGAGDAAGAVRPGAAVSAARSGSSSSSCRRTRRRCSRSARRCSRRRSSTSSSSSRRSTEKPVSKDELQKAIEALDAEGEVARPLPGLGGLTGPGRRSTSGRERRRAVLDGSARLRRSVPRRPVRPASSAHPAPASAGNGPAAAPPRSPPGRRALPPAGRKAPDAGAPRARFRPGMCRCAAGSRRTRGALFRVGVVPARQHRAQPQTDELPRAA